MKSAMVLTIVVSFSIPAADTVFDLASVTKQLTAAAVLKLEMQGKLATSDRISKYLAGVPKDKEQITIHHLLTHTAGVPDDVGGDYEVAPRDASEAPMPFPPPRRRCQTPSWRSIEGPIR